MHASAYRTRYPCTCYDVVSTCFQVSKTFAHTARIVFYSLNTFDIIPLRLESMVMGNGYDSVARGQRGAAFRSQAQRTQFIDN